MMQKPKISIITVVYNSKELLEKTVQSTQYQTYKEFEHIIVDGGSIDGTLEYIQSLSFDNLKYVSEMDKGIYDAMNKGIELSSGEYLLFLNAGDNFASDNVLKKIVDEINELASHPKVIYGAANVYSEDGRFMTTLTPLNFTKKNLNRYATRTVCHQSIFIHRNSIKKYSDKYRLKGELNWYYELIETIRHEEIHKSDTTVCNYYLGGTGDKNFIENYFERILVTRQHNNFLTFISLIPFFLIPLVFRLKRVIFGK